MDQTQRDLLVGLLASGGVRADDKYRAALDLLVEQGLCRLDASEPSYRLTEKGKLTAGSLLAPYCFWRPILVSTDPLPNSTNGGGRSVAGTTASERRCNAPNSRPRQRIAIA